MPIDQDPDKDSDASSHPPNGDDLVSHLLKNRAPSSLSDSSAESRDEDGARRRGAIDCCHYIHCERTHILSGVRQRVREQQLVRQCLPFRDAPGGGRTPLPPHRELCRQLSRSQLIPRTLSRTTSMWFTPRFSVRRAEARLHLRGVSPRRDSMGPQPHAGKA